MTLVYILTMSVSCTDLGVLCILAALQVPDSGSGLSMGNFSFFTGSGAGEFLIN